MLLIAIIAVFHSTAKRVKMCKRCVIDNNNAATLLLSMDVDASYYSVTASREGSLGVNVSILLRKKRTLPGQRGLAA